MSNGRTGPEIPRQCGFAGVFVAALVILFLCVWNYGYLIVETNDRVPASMAPLIERETGVQVATDDIRVGVYDSPATHRFFREMRFDYESLMESWREFLRGLGFAYRPFYRIDRIGEFDVVIFPFSSCLSDYEARRIKEYLAGGGSILMTGAVGSRYDDGRWRDEPVFGDIVGARFVGNANPSPRGPARLVLNRTLPVSLRRTPRAVLEVPVYNQVLAVRPVGTRMKTVASTGFSAGEDKVEQLTAFSVGPYLKGRVAWSGFRLGAFPPGNEILERAFRELFANTITWLGDLPRISAPLWPGDSDAALGLIVELNTENLPQVIERLASMDAPVALLMTPRQAAQFAKLPGAGDLRAEWIIRLDRAYLAAMTNSPEGWLERLRERVSALAGKPVRGVFFEAIKPRRAARMALRAGFAYLLSPPVDTIEEFPEIYASRRPLGPFEAPEVLSLAPFGRSLPEAVEPTGCHFVLLDSEEFLANPDPFAFAAGSEDRLWVTFPGDIVAWRSDRNSVVMEEEFLPGGRVRLGISNGSYGEFTDFPFRIRFLQPVEEVSIWPKEVGNPPPTVLSKDGAVWTFSISRFRSGRTHEYIFTPLEKTDQPEG